MSWWNNIRGVEIKSAASAIAKHTKIQFKASSCWPWYSKKHGITIGAHLGKFTMRLLKRLACFMKKLLRIGLGAAHLWGGLGMLLQFPIIIKVVYIYKHIALHFPRRLCFPLKNLFWMWGYFCQFRIHFCK